MWQQIKGQSVLSCWDIFLFCYDDYQNEVFSNYGIKTCN